MFDIKEEGFLYIEMFKFADLIIKGFSLALNAR